VAAQYAQCYTSTWSTNEEQGYEFENKIVGGVIPRSTSPRGQGHQGAPWTAVSWPGSWSKYHGRARRWFLPRRRLFEMAFQIRPRAAGGFEEGQLPVLRMSRGRHARGVHKTSAGDPSSPGTDPGWTRGGGLLPSFKRWCCSGDVRLRLIVRSKTHINVHHVQNRPYHEEVPKSIAGRSPRRAVFSGALRVQESENQRCCEGSSRGNKPHLNGAP